MPLKYGFEGKLTSGEILTYLIGIYEKFGENGPLFFRASSRHRNLVFTYRSSSGKFKKELAISLNYIPNLEDGWDQVIVTPHSFNQLEARSFLEDFVQNDQIFEDSGDLGYLKQQANSWRNILKREPYNPRKQVATVCSICNKNADPLNEVLPAIKGYMVQPWVVFLARHMSE